MCAYAERFLRMYGYEESIRLTYVNAARENDFGYNSMGSRQEKLEHFDRFLHIVGDTYSPDLIYVACNTLSVLLEETKFSKSGRIPVRGIVETGVNKLLDELTTHSQSVVTIFGTETTIEEQTYSNLLKQTGIDETRIVSLACPSLADTISEDRHGMKVQKKLKRLVRSAIERSQRPLTGHMTYLACTHYGYRKDYFSRAFKEQGVDTMILNPNEFVIDDLFGSPELSASRKECNIEVEFVTRYRIPETALETISFFLEDVSPKTIKAFVEYTHLPDLF